MSKRWFTYYFAVGPSHVKAFDAAGLKVDFLISFAEVVSDPAKRMPLDLIKRWRAAGHRVMLDSGAFTNYTKPGHVKFEQYLEYIKTEHKHFDEYVTFDDLRSRENTIKNWLLLRKAGTKPLFVDHLWMKEHPHVHRIWRREDKLCMSMWAKTSSHQDRFPQTPKEKFPERADLGRKVNTKAHLLACGSLTRVLQQADIISSVDSAAWGRGRGFGHLLCLEQRDFGGIKLPVMVQYDLPGKYCRAKDRPLTREHKASFAAFAKRIGWAKKINTHLMDLFIVDQLDRYQKAINAFDPKELVAAAQRHKQRARKGDMPFDTRWDDDFRCFEDDLDYIERGAAPDEDRRKVIIDLNPRGLSKVAEDELLELHSDAHVLVHEELTGLPEAHLFIVQEMSKRGIPHDSEDGVGLDMATRDLATGLGLQRSELETLGLVQKATAIQSIIFDKKVFKTPAQVHKWITDHGFTVGGKKKVKVEKPGIEETTNSFRVRQKDPSEFVEGTLRTIDITDGVKAVVGQLKEQKVRKADEDELGFWDEDAEDDEMLGPVMQSKLLPLEKAEKQDQRVVAGVVLEPDSVDTQGDTISAEQIQRAAHLWLARFQDRGFMHRQIVNSKIEIYESYVAPIDMKIGGQKVKKGTWVLMYHILDDALWAAIKRGDLTGFSMGGFARRVQP